MDQNGEKADKQTKKHLAFYDQKLCLTLISIKHVQIQNGGKVTQKPQECQVSNASKNEAKYKWIQKSCQITVKQAPGDGLFAIVQFEMRKTSKTCNLALAYKIFHLTSSQTW